MVYGREIDGKVVTFGTSGYTMSNVFVLYDRETESVWYPTDEKHLEATSGARQGTRIEFLEKPTPMPLGQWRKMHPKTRVLLPE
ncbi:MAG: DUF3179 domain-containing protein [Planctomycetes bacterium]|nr:DUF3179 domain-containing protein [Planctomycetota bacterium]